MLKIILLLLAGGYGFSALENFILKFNIVGKSIDLFRSTEAIAQKEIHRGEALLANARVKLLKLRGRL